MSPSSRLLRPTIASSASAFMLSAVVLYSRSRARWYLQPPSSRGSSHGCILSGEHASLAFAHGVSRINGRTSEKPRRGRGENLVCEGTRWKSREVGRESSSRIDVPRVRSNKRKKKKRAPLHELRCSRLELTSIFGAIRATAELTGEHIPKLRPM